MALTWTPGVTGPVVRPLSAPSGGGGPTASLSGTGTLTAAGSTATGGTAALTGTGTLTSAGSSTAPFTFVIAAACGASVPAGTALTPSGWTPLATVTASNGTDHAGDTVLAAACTTVSTSSATATATATTAEAISAMILGVVTSAPSPVPAGVNPNWPYVAFEAAFGSGYQTPPDQMTWTNLQTADAGFRCRKWDETTGIQYELDALESSELDLVLDNPDGALSPENPSSPWYPDVVPGTPVRLRCVPPAATGASRWYVIQRNMERWPQSWDEQFRGIVNGTGNDYWAVVNKQLATCYRAEVVADQPYAWWPCDDPAVIPLPTSLVNAAPGNSLPLAINASPNGLSVSLTGHPFTGAVVYSATQDFAQASGWMYGDPVSSAWQQAGTGDNSHGRYLSCSDAGFPPVSGGVTVEGWWNLPFLGTGSGKGTGIVQGPYTQPTGTLTLWQMASATGNVARLQLSTAGALQIVAGATTATIYSATDLRNTTWLGVTVTLTTSGWQAWVNGGVAATASGSASIPSSWSWFYAAGGTSGTSPPGSGTVTGICNAAVSHLAVYGQVLPVPRIMAHYMAAYAAFGQIPAPAVSVQFIDGDASIGAYAPDGTLRTGMAFISASAGIGGIPSIAALTTGQGAGLTSGPAVPEAVAIVPPTDNPSDAEAGFMWLTAGGPAAPSYAWYTATGAGAEKLAGTSVAAYQYANATGGGASPPAAPSALGDTAQNRIERLLQAGNVTTPQRAIDASPTAIVAALDTGGQACGSAVASIAGSDGGLLFVDTTGALCYFSRPHLAGMPVTWVLGEETASGEIPYEPDAMWDTDPQQVKNDIAITQSSVAPDSTAGTGGASSGSAEQTTTGVTFAPDGSRFAAIQASQAQNGDQQYQASSYLQDISLIQSQSNWIADIFGRPVQRITNLTVNAASKTGTAPASWLLVLSANVGDVVTVTRRPPGQPSFTGSWRISKLHRTIDWSAGVASISITGDVLPSYEW